jgi:hypothetical protein
VTLWKENNFRLISYLTIIKVTFNLKVKIGGKIRVIFDLVKKGKILEVTYDLVKKGKFLEDMEKG